MKGCWNAAMLILAAFFVGASVGVALERRQGDENDARAADRAAIACHDDRIRAEALSDQCARLADHECAGTVRP